MKFIVYSCRCTFELCNEAKKAGFQHVWTPLQLVKRLRQPKNRAPYFEETWEVAVPGYVYAPWLDYERFWRWCPQKFNIGTVPYYFGEAGIKRTDHLEHVKPATVELDDLLDHENAVRELRKVLSMQISQGVNFQVGDQVEFPVGKTTMQGSLHSFKSGNRARVEIPLGFMTVDLTQAKRVNSG